MSHDDHYSNLHVRLQKKTEALLLKMRFGNVFYYGYMAMTPDHVGLHVRARKPYNPHRADFEPQPARTLVPLFRTGQKLGLRKQQSTASYLGRAPPTL